MKLRDYQTQGIGEVRDLFQVRNKLLYVAATGSGKTVVFCHLVQEHMEHRPIIVVVRGKSLVHQASQNLDKFKISHSVLQGDHYKFDRKSPIQCCSIDSIASRKALPFKDSNPLIIVDECHNVNSSGKKYMDFLSNYPHSKCIGFTATPFGDNSYFEEIINPIEPYQLMEQGYLVPIETFIPSLMDVTGVKISHGEYNQRQLFDAVAKSTITGDIVDSWKKLGDNKRTILFAVNVEHSKMIRDRFLESEIPAVHVDANTSIDERAKVIKEFKEGKIKVICNCDVFSTGIDIPEIEVIQLCRPTKSLTWFIQSIGRGTRPSKDKAKCRVIDNAGNTMSFGHFYMPREIRINPPKVKELPKIKMTICKNCFFAHDKTICPNCGVVIKTPRVINQIEGELIKYEIDEEEIKKSHFIKKYRSLKKTKRSYVPSYEYQVLLKEFGKETCRKYAGEVGFPQFLLKD